MDSRSSYIHKDGVSLPDPANPRAFFTHVGVWSEHDPSWEVRSVAKNLPFLPYHLSSVTLELYRSLISVAHVPS